jgi:hypothetical protein
MSLAAFEEELKKWLIDVKVTTLTTTAGIARNE